MFKTPLSFTRKNMVRTASLFLLFALLSNVFYIPCYLYMRSITRDSAMEQFHQRLTDGVDKLNTTFTALSSLQSLLGQNVNFRTLTYLTSNPSETDLKTMCSMASTYVTAHDLVWETGLTRGDDILFTRSRLYYERDNLTVEHYFSQEGLSTAEFVRQFTGSVCVLPAASFESTTFRRYEAFTVAWRWSRANNVYFFATFPVDKVFSVMAESGLPDAGCITLSLGDTVIAQQGAVPETSCETLEIDTILPSLHITLLLPDSYIEESLSSLRRLVTVFLLVMGVATVLWIVSCTASAARPLNRIVASLKGSRHLQTAMDGDSTSGLVQGLQQLDQRIDNYEGVIAEQQERLRMQVLERALYRGLFNEESLASFRAAFPKFPQSWRLAYLQFAAEGAASDASLLTLFTSFLQQELARAILLPVEQDTLLLVLSCGEGEDPAAALEKLRAEAQAHYAIAFDSLLSGIHDDPKELAEAYQQLEYAATTASELGESTTPVKFPLTLQQLQTMYMALTCGDETVSLGTLHDCARAVHDAADFVLAKHTYRMISNMLVMIKLESRCDLSDVVIPLFDRDAIASLFDEQLPACFRHVCGRIATQKQAVTRTLEDGIITCIDENLSNPDLCIGMVTDEFRISAPTLQKRLHASAGMTFSAYVENARMNKARTLLRETSRSVQDIAESCGYANVNSFYKAYKRRFGEPPLAARVSRK